MALMAAALHTTFAAQPPTDNITSLGAQFVDLLVKEDFAGAAARFDPTMKTALPEQKLRETWQTLQKQAGPFKQQVRSRVEKQMGYDVVLVTCQFARIALRPQ